MPALDDAMKPFKKYRVYTFRQKRELKAIGKADSEGICHSISMDWIRRLLFRTATFGHWKYHGLPGLLSGARQKLIKKHYEMQKKLTDGSDPQELTKMHEANEHTKRPFTSLEKVASSSTPCHTWHERHRKYEIDLDKFRSVMGLLVDSLADGQLRVPAYWGPQAPVDAQGRPYAAILGYTRGLLGHSLGCAKADGAWLFFDPNIGEYRTGEEAEFRKMVEANWVVYYRREDANLHNVGLTWVRRTQQAGTEGPPSPAAGSTGPRRRD
jgi:hypothetical protein